MITHFHLFFQMFLIFTMSKLKSALVVQVLCLLKEKFNNFLWDIIALMNTYNFFLIIQFFFNINNE